MYFRECRLYDFITEVKVNEQPKQHRLQIAWSLSVLTEYQCHRVKGILNSAKCP